MRAFLVASLLAVPLMSQDRTTGAPFASRSMVIAPHAVAATSHPLATQAALDVMRAGGSAVDAAIAANAMLALGEPTGSGLGGDLFAIVWDPAGRKLFGLNGSGRSPAGLSTAELRRQLAARGLERIPATGVLPISVPGCVDGWTTLHARFGRLPLARVLAPAIAAADEGIPVPPVIAHAWQRGGAALAAQPGFADVFLPGGRAPAVGERFRNPALATTLRAIAEGGRDAFYDGPIAAELVRFVREHGGYLALDDLRDHHAEWVAPVSTTYRGYTVWELPPNGQGIAALQMLNVLELHDVRKLGFGSVDYAHLFVEAKKLAFADRAAFYADMAFADVPVERLLAKGYAKRQNARIDMAHAATDVPAGGPEHGDTVYLTTADEHGMMVSLIQSNYRGFGSGVTPPKLGFCLQDRGELFDVTPGRANSHAPGKRPFHTIIPAFVTKDGEPWLSFGVMGGAMQPQGHVQILVDLIDFDMDLQEAGDAMRIRHEGSQEPTGEPMEPGGGTVHVEARFPPALVDGLRARGHRVVVEPGDPGFGGYQAIQWDAAQRVWRAASEFRKDGCAAGY